MSKISPCSNELRKKLSELGFLKNGIVEAIVCTYDELGKPNAAPMGIFTQDLLHLVIQPFVQTSTYKNLLSSRCCTVNITADPAIYHRTTFKNRTSSSWLLRAELVNAPRLKDCDAWLEAKVKRASKKTKERASFLCEVVNIVEARRLKPKAYSRARFAVIESIIHTTRIEPFLSQGRVKEAKRLLSLIHHYDEVVSKVAPDSAYSRLMDDIVKRAEGYYQKFL